MPMCTACGGRLPDGSRFCPACGAPADGMPAAHERKLATMLFADLVGSTAAAADRDPEHTRLLLDRFYGGMATEIRAVDGTLEKFAGDAVMAVFGAPAAFEDHAERALHAALSMRRRLHEMFGDALALRVGVNTGEVVLGRPNEGSSFVSGDAVNVAARLEQAAAAGEILVGERTVRAVGGVFEFAAARTVEAKGKPEGIPCRPLLRALSLTRSRGAGHLARAFVGRDADLVRLTDAYRRTVALRRPQRLTIVGDPGVGKTRLVRELWAALVLETPEPLRRVGRCLAYGSASAYQPLGDVLREQLGILDSDPPERVLSLIASREILGLALGLDVAADLHPLVVRERFQQAWTAFFDDLTAERPTVLLVEDLHWADEPLLELLEALAEKVRGPLLVLATSRPQDAPLRQGDVVRLEPLDQAAAERLLAELIGAKPPAEVVAIADRAEGNPFVIEELVATLIDRSLLTREGGAWRLEELPPEFSLPDSVHALLAARIDLLPPGEKAALQSGALIGRAFSAGAVRALVDDLDIDFSLLEGRGFVYRRQRSTLSGDVEYVIKHALTREVAYTSIPKSRRPALHLGFAEWLDARSSGRDEVAATLAHHYAEAARADYAPLAWPEQGVAPAPVRAKAVQWLRRAAELAVGRYELRDATRLLDRALALVDASSERFELWREIAAAHALAYDSAAFVSASEEAISLAPDEASVGGVYADLAGRAATAQLMWNPPLSQKVVETWIDRALAAAPPGSVDHAKALLAKAHYGGHAEEPARQVLAIADRVGDPTIIALGLRACLLGASTSARHDLVAEYEARLFQMLDQVDDPGIKEVVLQAPLRAAMADGRLADARDVAAMVDEIVRELTPHHRLHGAAFKAEVEELVGEWAAIRDLADSVADAVDANRETPCARNARSLLVCALAEEALGDGESAASYERRAANLGMEGHYRVLDPLRIRLALLRGDLGEVDRLLARYGDPHVRFTWEIAGAAAWIDGTAALGRRSSIEREAPRLARAAVYLEPFVLRARGAVLRDDTLVAEAAARFDALSLPWHAERTRQMVF